MTLDAVDVATRILGRPPWPHQVPALRSERFGVVIVGGRRSGKTAVAQVKALTVALSHRDGRVIVVSPTIDNARNFLRELAALIRSTPLVRDAVIDDTSMSITFKNGARVDCLPATSGQLRGRGQGLRLIVFEEAAYMPESVWRDARYALLDMRSEGSQALLISSPWGGPQHFFRLAWQRGIDGDQDFASFQWPMSLNPTLSAAFRERERERTAPGEAMAEIDGQWPDNHGSFFGALVERQALDLDLPSALTLAGPARPIVGCDFGVSFDRSAMALIYRLPVRSLNPDHDGRPVFLLIPFVFEQAAPLGLVVETIVGLPSNPAYLSLELNGPGSYPSEEIRNRLARRGGPRRTWNLHFTTSRSKTVGYMTLLGLAEAGRLWWPRDPGLLRQLHGLRIERGERGFTRIEADDPAVHDDVCDAAMLAALPYSPSGSKGVRSGLLELADPRRAPADADVRALDCEVITTPTGLRVYRRPALQGVRDRYVTLPEATDAEIRPDPRLDEARARGAKCS